MRTPEQEAWKSMMKRCSTPTFQYYHRYGGRGIQVCDRWHQRDNFIADMGLRPSSKHSLDRIDNNGDYTPDNCRWATREQQAHNKGIQKNNTSGIPGVTWDKTKSNWKVRIHLNNRQICLGTSASLSKATAMRLAGKAKYHARSF